MMKAVAIFIVSSLLFVTNTVAYQLEKKTLREAVDSSVKVAKIKVVKSELVLNDGYNCGADYSVDVITGFKGGDSGFVFRSSSPLVVGGEYLVFANSKNLDASTNYLAMGKNDMAGYEACTENELLYASSLHGEVFEFDSLWKIATEKVAVKSIVELPYLSELEAEKIEFKSDKASDIYLEGLSYWRVCWSSFKENLVALTAN
ncbi:hypothetical protein [uncultured Pseudoteredinibacter sp.]|uniref:hypothetical protein n=1 Tax=uncultured Pseudoteredinibacter sp. TaxID=1641701 RepID=UPI002639B958|nr:hypothetical protein [uncultured Pseudoteredinibacter sp.]